MQFKISMHTSVCLSHDYPSACAVYVCVKEGGVTPDGFTIVVPGQLVLSTGEHGERLGLLEERASGLCLSRQSEISIHSDIIYIYNYTYIYQNVKMSRHLLLYMYTKVYLT